MNRSLVLFWWLLFENIAYKGDIISLYADNFLRLIYLLLYQQNSFCILKAIWYFFSMRHWFNRALKAFLRVLPPIFKIMLVRWFSPAALLFFIIPNTYWISNAVTSLLIFIIIFLFDENISVFSFNIVFLCSPCYILPLQANKDIE